MSDTSGNIFLVQLLIEVDGGRKFESYFRQRFFKPTAP